MGGFSTKNEGKTSYKDKDFSSILHTGDFLEVTVEIKLLVGL